MRLPDEEIDEKRDDLVIDGGFTTLNDCKAPAVEHLIQKADDYPDLDALEGYDAKHIVIDPRREEGITVSDIPSPAERQHGITKAPFERQLSSRQAEQLLKLTAEIKYYAT